MSKLLSKIRMWQWLVISMGLIALLAFLAPEQLGVMTLKSALISTAAVIGYYIDRCLFPYARPHAAREEVWREISTHTYKDERLESAYKAFHANMIRRAIVVAGTMIAFAIGL